MAHLALLVGHRCRPHPPCAGQQSLADRLPHASWAQLPRSRRRCYRSPLGQSPSSHGTGKARSPAPDNACRHASMAGRSALVEAWSAPRSVSASGHAASGPSDQSAGAGPPSFATSRPVAPGRSGPVPTLPRYSSTRARTPPQCRSAMSSPVAETSRPPAASNLRESPGFHDRRRLGGRRGSSMRHRTAGICQSSGHWRCAHGGAPGTHAGVPHGCQQRHDRAAVQGPVGLGGAPRHRAVLARSGHHRQSRAAHQRQRRLPGSPASARDVSCHLAGPCGPQQHRRHRLPARPADLRRRATVMAGRRIRHRATFISRHRGRSGITTGGRLA
jgi:hypothetical protein